MMSTGPQSYVEKTLFCLGFLLICAALVGNEWLLTKLLSPDGVVEFHNRVAIWLFDLSCFPSGALLVLMGKLLPSRYVLRRLSHSYPRTCICSIGLVLPSS